MEQEPGLPAVLAACALGSFGIATAILVVLWSLPLSMTIQCCPATDTFGHTALLVGSACLAFLTGAVLEVVPWVLSFQHALSHHRTGWLVGFVAGSAVTLIPTLFVGVNAFAVVTSAPADTSFFVGVLIFGLIAIFLFTAPFALPIAAAVLLYDWRGHPAPARP